MIDNTELRAYDIVRRPLVTEKSTDQSNQNKYSFVVSKCATKTSVKKSIEKIFSVDVVSVNILNCKGKQKRFKGRVGNRVNLKKAIVTLNEKDYIDFEIKEKK